MESSDLYTEMYAKLPNLTIAFHGCNQETYNNVIKENQPLNRSLNRYDWLGNGIYFWENSYHRALEWAQSHYAEGAAVIGAVIDLGYCLFEGKEVFLDSCFYEKTHIQICIVNPNCIKGYFAPQKKVSGYNIP